MGLLIELIHVISLVLTVLTIARAVLSWVNLPSNKLVIWIYRLTEPMLAPIQSILPAPGGIDFSPLVVLLLIQLIERLLISLLINIS
jgi:YggT family protein